MNLPLVSTLQGIVPVSSLGSCWSLWRRKRPRLKSELNFLELNNSKAYKCHYLSPICDPDSRTRFSLSFKELVSSRIEELESSYFPLLGFQMMLRAPNAMATEAVKNLTWKCGMERTSWRWQPQKDKSHPPEGRREAGPLLHCAYHT